MSSIRSEDGGLPTGWRRVRAEQVALQQKGAIVSGPFGSNIGKRFFVDSGVPVIRGSNLTLGVQQLVDEGYVFITDTKAHELRNCEAIRGDIVFTAAGTLGQVGRIPESSRFARYIVSNKQLRLRPDPKTADSKYLYYWFSSPSMRRHIQDRNTGASIPLITLSTLRDLPVNLPPLEQQRRIAAILTAYDDLIGNNQRRIHILEQIARTVYREWFVEFRFPGHDRVRFVSSSVGHIPEGWNVKKVTESFGISGGGTPSRRECSYWDGGTIQWFAPSDITRAGTMFMDDSPGHITERGLAESSARLLPPFSVMMTSRATIGAIAINTHEACTNQGFITCIPNEQVPLHFLFHWVAENVPQFTLLASGATFKEISRGVFRTIDFLHPNPVLVRRFESLVDPIAKQILALQRTIENLRRTRDLLLSRLLSGQMALGQHAA